MILFLSGLVSSWVFWILLCGFVFVWVSTKEERLVLGLLVVAITLALLQFIADVQIVAWVVANPSKLIGYAIGYYVVGLIWSFIKWYLYLIDERNHWRLKKQGITSEEIKSWMPSFSGSKNKIAVWIGYWPISFIITLLEGVFEKFAKYLRDAFTRRYEAIWNSVINGVDKK